MQRRPIHESRPSLRHALVASGAAPLPAFAAEPPYAAPARQVEAIHAAFGTPSVAWPETRKLMKLGTITSTQVAPNQQAINRSLLFLPSRVPTGTDVADPTIAVRSAAYPISFGQRQ